jgi:phosphoribosylanthranilate isomerase
MTNAVDALDAIEAGADALGFNFYRGSPRYIDIESSRDWIARLPATIGKIAVLVNPTLAEAVAMAELPFIDALQLHGDESPEFCHQLAERGVVFAKAIGVRDETSLDQVPAFSTGTLLLDSRTRGFGGSGQTFQWSLAARFSESHPELKLVLAGGLTADNVTEAIRLVRPFAVDVTSGVESSPGRKDALRLREFIGAVRAMSI